MLDREVELLDRGRQERQAPALAGGPRPGAARSTPADATVAAARKRAVQEALQSIDEIKVAKKPRNLKATLRPYQEQGLSWLQFLHDIGSGGILADDMGLGKTVADDRAPALRVKQEEEGRALTRAHRRADQRRHELGARDRAVRAVARPRALWHGAGRKEQTDELEDADVVITSYALLRRDEELLAKLDLDYAILDEAQHIKNPLSATARGRQAAQAPSAASR